MTRIIPRAPPDKIFPTRWRIPSILTPSFVDVLGELLRDVSSFGNEFFFTGATFLVGIDFFDVCFGSETATTDAVFFVVAGAFAFGAVFFTEAVFFAAGDFSCVDAFFVGLFFVWVFIGEILEKVGLLSKRRNHKKSLHKQNNL